MPSGAMAGTKITEAYTKLKEAMSSSGMSRLRFREGSASKSRLRGHFDEAFIAI